MRVKASPSTGLWEFYITGGAKQLNSTRSRGISDHKDGGNFRKRMRLKASPSTGLWEFCITGGTKQLNSTRSREISEHKDGVEGFILLGGTLELI
ncbi:hypothetical protein CDAR_90241 [Caerostris darwini]|uniref:Uncharacterized protein n=1 Tax=Caerostris darwini TaxID=1538125 RepID=A0AAV4NQV8_9ARAC|nr:hypothetical protein CDAR_90241 [Caerostris darwini]